MPGPFKPYRSWAAPARVLPRAWRAMALVLAAELLSAGSGQAASTERDVKEGNTFYQKGDFSQALKKYSDALNNSPESPEVNYNVGTAYYKTGDYKKAGALLEKSFLSDDPKLREKGFYNAGNALYRNGIAQENKSLDEAIALLKQALGYYENSLKIDDKDEDARYNYKFVEQELKRLEEKRKKGEKTAGDKQKKEEQKDQQREKTPGQKEEGQPNLKLPPSTDENQKKNAADKQDNPQKGPEQKNEGQPNEETTRKEQAVSAEQNVPRQHSSDMTKDESEMLLDEYRRQEEPQGLLNFIKRKGRESPVVKDW